jgi:hypothetical protein
MNKRLISLTLLLFFIIAFTVSFIILATDKAAAQIDPTKGLIPQKCCQLKHDIDTFSKGQVLGPPGINLDPNQDVCVQQTNSSVNETPNWAGYCTLDGIQTVADWVMWIALVAVAVAMIFAGFMFITSAGSPDRVEKAKKIFIYSLIGILIAVGAQFIPALVKYFIGI